ncbi:MAG: hypothetical protein ACREMJ_01220 [Gemmatimonadales bacterium]
MRWPGWLHGERRLLAEALALALAVAAAHLLLRLSAGFLVGALNDDGVYVVLGKAIAEGDGYRSIHLVGAPAHLRYPPGLPLLLAIPWALGGSLGAVRATVGVLNLLATATAAGLLWWVGRRRLGLAPWPLAVCAASPFVLDGTTQYYNIPLTEPYLVLGWAAALVIAYPLVDAGALTPRRIGRAVALGLVLAATTLFRSAGAVLLPAILLALALHRRWRETVACAAGILLPLAAWAVLRAAWTAQAPVSSHPDDVGYWRWLGVEGPLALVGYAGRTVAMHAVEYLVKLASYLVSSRWIGVGLVGAATAAAGLACVRWWRAHTALVLTTLAASALTLLWPFAQGRLLLPLLPFLGLLAAGTVDLGLRRVPANLRRVAPAALGFVVLAVTLRQVELREAAARAYQTGVLPPPADLSPILTLAVRSRFIARVVGMVQERTAPADRVMVDAPAAVYLYTGRRTVSGQPTESGLAPSVFHVPGRYLAERILADSVTVVVWAPPAPALEQDLAAVATRCPGVLMREATAPAMFYRVTRNEACLRKRVLEGGAR